MERGIEGPIEIRLYVTVGEIWCVDEVGDHHGQETGLKCDFDPTKKMWTFGSGSLLCQRFKRKRGETAWKGRRIESPLVVVIVILYVLTYVVSYKLFWN